MKTMYWTFLGKETRHKDDKYRKLVLCRCVCGAKRWIRKTDYIQGKSTNCGCKRKTTATHGKSKSKIYKKWRSIRERCENPNVRIYKWYGGKGVKVCERWQAFEKFYADMGDVPKGMTIDRIDSNGDYCPENCRWATMLEQANNKSSTIKYDYKGKKLTLSEIAKIEQIDRSLLHRRIFYKGMDLEHALSDARRRKRWKKNQNIR